MKAIEIDLTAPLARVLAATRSLPANGSEARESENEVREATRCLYEAAHGRVVDTSIGAIAIAPAVASALKDVPMAMTTRAEFLDFAEANSLFRRTTRPPVYMKNLPIHITAHDLDLSPTLHGFIERKMSALSRFARDILVAEVVLRGKSGAAHLFSVSARLSLPGRDVQANAKHANVYGAIEQLVSRLGRLSRKRKTRLLTAFRRPRKTRLKEWPAPSHESRSAGIFNT
jgi:putative sigma-54 modulation protein